MNLVKGTCLPLLTLFARLPGKVHFFIFEILFLSSRFLKKRFLTRAHAKIINSPFDIQVKDVFYNTYLNGLAMIQYRLAPKRNRIICLNEKQFQSIATDSFGHVVYGIHCGAFELMHMALSNSHKKTYVITARLGNETIEALLFALRMHPNCIYITPEDYPNYHKHIIREKAIVAVLIDQSNSIPSMSCELDALSIPLYSKLVEKLFFNNFKVACISTARNEFHEHSVSLKLLEVKSADVVQLREVISQSVVNIISDNPSQWIWHYPSR